MSIRKREGKKGTTYQVVISYKDCENNKITHYQGGFLTKRAAKNYENEMCEQLRKHGTIPKNCTKTFNEIFYEYMDLEKEKYSKSTYIYYLNTFNNYLKNSLGKREITSLTYHDIQKFIDNINNGVSIAENVTKIIKVTFKYALINGYIENNPATHCSLKKVKKKETEGKEKKVLTYEELENFINLIIIPPKNTDEMIFTHRAYAVALYIGWFLGLRLSEVFGLKKEDFDFENNIVHIQRRLEYAGLKKSEYYLTEKLKTKNSKADLVIHEELKKILLMWFDENPYEYVICDINGNFLTPHAYQSTLKRASDQIEISITSHCMRHSMITNLALNNTNPVILKTLARHSNVDTSYKKYTHVNTNEMQKALDAALDKQVGQN